MRRLKFLALLFLLWFSAPVAARQMDPETAFRKASAPPLTTLAVSTDGTVLAGAPSGVYRSTDSGQSWVAHDEGLTGLGRIVRTALLAPDGTEWLGTEGGLYRRGASEAVWTPVGPGGRRVNAVALAGRIVQAGTSAGVARTMDGGATWTRHSVAQGTPEVRSLAAHGSLVLAGTADGVYVSSDAGSSWAPAGPGLGNVDVTAVVRMSTGSWFVASRNTEAGCTLYRSRSDGGLWSCIAPDRITFRVEAMTETASGDLVVAGEHWVAMSPDEGYTWTVRQAGSSIVRAIAAIGSTILAGTSDAGVLRSEGSVFVPSNEGLVEGWERVDLLAVEGLATTSPTARY